MTGLKVPEVVDRQTWQREIDALRAREKAATRELSHGKDSSCVRKASMASTSRR